MLFDYVVNENLYMQSKVICLPVSSVQYPFFISCKFVFVYPTLLIHTITDYHTQSPIYTNQQLVTILYIFCQTLHFN